MINRYSDHAANERTFLAWVRTAITVMAFGFLVEKFDIFLEVASKTLVGSGDIVTGHRVGDIAGLLLILLGGVVMTLALVRFRRTEKAIDDQELRTSGTSIDVALVILLALLGAALFFYLLYTVVRQM